MIISGRMLRGIARLLAISLLLTSIFANPARAALVSTEQAIAATHSAGSRARVEAFLAREDVQAELVALGVDPAQAAARVARLSDAEIERIAGHLDSLPAGEGAIGAVIGAAIFIFLVLLITDLLGLTDVYPFVRR